MSVTPRRWPRFSLRTLFVLVTAAAIAVSWKIHELGGNPQSVMPVPILGPLTAGGPVSLIDPPSDDEILRALERSRPVPGGAPIAPQLQRNNLRIVKEKIAELIDPPRVMPLVGRVQQHHAHYKCQVYHVEPSAGVWQRLSELFERDVIYVDHTHLHMLDTTSRAPATK